MIEPSSHDALDIADELFDLIPRLLRRIRADIPRDTDDIAPEWRDILELRATKGQLKLLRVLMTRQRCTMQELADQLDVAPPTVTAMVKRLLTQGFVERVRDEQDWRVVQVLPTERGQRAVSLYEEFWRANLQRLLVHLSQEELTQLRVALPILRHMSELEL
ncbi:MAG TPA: MarR family transcriptional regulator [Ktedonobacteraceae bacterium]|jgi:MarR family transcriptional regulator, organic hydroperoxide resistance regulator|nr:MarR family transcriptional regulator [Ktedonobacteraceae bacterium]